MGEPGARRKRILRRLTNERPPVWRSPSESGDAVPISSEIQSAACAGHLRSCPARYADIRFELERAGRPIGERDLLIASTARARGLTVVTHNVSEFSRVPHLAVEDWL